MHITASVFINDDESGLHHDYEVWLGGLPPRVPTSQYQHSRSLNPENKPNGLAMQVAFTLPLNLPLVAAATTYWLD